MFVPSTGQSALHIALTNMTIDERMLDLLLRHGASPYIPDKSGEGMPHQLLPVALEAADCQEPSAYEPTAYELTAYAMCSTCYNSTCWNIIMYTSPLYSFGACAS